MLVWLAVDCKRQRENNNNNNNHNNNIINPFEVFSFIFLLNITVCC